MEKLKLYTWQFFVNNIGGFVLLPIKLRIVLYKFFGMKIQAKGFEPNIKFYSNKISFGKNCYINQYCYFNNFSDIIIGEGCFIGPQVSLLTISHEIASTKQRAGTFFSKPIIIKDGVWIGANTIILPGVTIEEGCVIAAGSVVTKNCKPNNLYAGNPAVLKKKLN